MTADPLAESLLGAPTLTTREVAREAGVEPAEARRLWQALGFPPAEHDERLFTHADVEILRAVRALLERQDVDPADLVQLTRVVGQSLARVADALVTAAGDRLERVRAAAVADDVAAGELRERVAALSPRLEQVLGYVWRRHLAAALRRRAAVRRPTSASRSASPTWSGSPR
jgi:adenylate cyclase